MEIIRLIFSQCRYPILFKQPRMEVIASKCKFDQSFGLFPQLLPQEWCGSFTWYFPGIREKYIRKWDSYRRAILKDHLWLRSPLYAWRSIAFISFCFCFFVFRRLSELSLHAIFQENQAVWSLLKMVFRNPKFNAEAWSFVFSLAFTLISSLLSDKWSNISWLRVHTSCSLFCWNFFSFVFFWINVGNNKIAITQLHFIFQSWSVFRMVRYLSSISF